MLSLHRQINDRVAEAVAQLGEIGGRLWELIYLVKANPKTPKPHGAFDLDLVNLFKFDRLPLIT